MHVPICLIDIFEESQKVYSEGDKGQTIYLINGYVFSDKKVATKFKKVAEYQNAMGGGRGIGEIKAVKLDSVSEAELDKDLQKIKDKQKKSKE